MKKSITIGKDIFGYEIKGNHAVIVGYQFADGKIVFTENEEGSSKRYFSIRFPESIDGLPVLSIAAISLDIDLSQYRHNGMDLVEIIIPENTAFSGLEQVRKDAYSVLTPNFTTKYYQREMPLLYEIIGAFVFFAERIDDATCDITAIVNNNDISEDWVWSNHEKTLNNTKKQEQDLSCLIVPPEIDGLKVKAIRRGSTDFLSQKITEIHIGEGVEIIEECCFSNLPLLADVYLPDSLKIIENSAFNYYRKSEYLPDTPALTAHYRNELPKIAENAFSRYADREEYEDYSDWGNMYVGSTRIEYDVIYQKE